jgi:hypothetical protein
MSGRSVAPPRPTRKTFIRLKIGDHAILAPSRRRGDVHPERPPYPPRGVRCDGLLFLVRPLGDDSCDLAPPGDEPAAGLRELMFLTVVDESRVADVGTIADRPAAYRPDSSGVEHVEDPGDLGTAG